VGRHHSWAAGPLGLGLSLYIVPHLLLIQHFIILHGIIGLGLGFLPPLLPLQPPAAPSHPAAACHRCPREAQPSLPGAASFLPAAAAVSLGRQPHPPPLPQLAVSLWPPAAGTLPWPPRLPSFGLSPTPSAFPPGRVRRWRCCGSTRAPSPASPFAGSSCSARPRPATSWSATLLPHAEAPPLPLAPAVAGPSLAATLPCLAARTPPPATGHHRPRPRHRGTTARARDLPCPAASPHDLAGLRAPASRLSRAGPCRAVAAEARTGFARATSGSLHTGHAGGPLPLPVAAQGQSLPSGPPRRRPGRWRLASLPSLAAGPAPCNHRQQLPWRPLSLLHAHMLPGRLQLCRRLRLDMDAPQRRWRLCSGTGRPFPAPIDLCTYARACNHGCPVAANHARASRRQSPGSCPAVAPPRRPPPPCPR
jgi:hypothetical protein